MQISISPEVSISNSQQALEKGGVWLIVEMNLKGYSHYLSPKNLTAWIEGKSISHFGVFPELPEDIRSEIHEKFDAELRRIVR